MLAHSRWSGFHVVPLGLPRAGLFSRRLAMSEDLRRLLDSVRFGCLDKGQEQVRLVV